MKQYRNAEARRIEKERIEKNRELWKQIGPKIVELYERVEALEAKLK